MFHSFVLAFDIRTDYWLVMVKLGRDWQCVNEKAELYIEQRNFENVNLMVHTRKKQSDIKSTKRPAKIV